MGQKKDLSRRQAKIKCDRLAAKLTLNLGIADTCHHIKIEDFIKRYLNNRTDLRKSTLESHRLSGDYLKEFFGEDI